MAAAVLPSSALAEYFVAAGRDSTFVVEDGAVRATGRNQYGQLGIGSFDDADTLKDVQFPDATFDSDRSDLPESWDNRTKIKVTQVAAGAFHTLFLLNTGEVFATGRARDGRLGLCEEGTECANRNSPERVSFDSERVDQFQVKSVAAGYAHSVFLMGRPRVTFVTGSNAVGQLCLPRTETTGKTLPTWLGKYNFTMVAAGYDFTYLATDDEAIACGQNLGGQLGIGTNAPPTFGNGGWERVSLPSDRNIKAVHAGESHGFFIDQDNNVWGTGANFDGQLGDGTTARTNTPVKLPFTAEVLSAGGDSSCKWSRGGSKLECFGSNRDGQLGLKQKTTVLNPTPVSNEEDEEIDYADSIAVANSHSIFLSHDKVYVTGKNMYGQLGNSSLDDITRPVMLTELGRGTRPPTPAPTPAPPTPEPLSPTPSPSPSPDTTRNVQEVEGQWPVVPLLGGVACGLGIVVVVVKVFGGEEAATPLPQPSEVTELGAREAGRSMHDQTV